MVVSPADRQRHRTGSVRAWPRIWAIVLVAAVVGGFGSVFSVTPAQAYGLVASEPGVRQELDRAPGWVTLAFATEVDPSVAKVLVQDADGANVTIGSLIVEGTNLTTQLKDGLKPGTYTVSYRVNRPDGEPEGGAYQFAYGAGDFSEPPDPTWTGRAEEPEAMNDPDPNAVTPRATAKVDVPDVEVERRDSPPPTTAGESTPPSATGTPTPTTSSAGAAAATSSPSPAPGAPGSGLDMPPWPVWLALGAFGLFLIIAAVAFLRSRR